MNSTMMQMKGRKVHCRQDYDDHPDHVAITERLRKTLYFGKTPELDRPSLPLTQLAVEFCQDAAQRELGKVDTFVAASMGRKACMSPCSMVLGLLYIERLKKKNPNYLRRVNSSDLFLISMMMASKYVYDEGVDEEVFNDEWAESARMETDEVNDLEMDFLSAMDWGLFVRTEDFESALHSIEKRIALTQGLDRNWFSYTDLWVLFQDPKYQQLWQETRTELTKVFLACSLAYVASVLTMVGSVIVLSYASASVSMVTPVLLPLLTASSRQIPHEPKAPTVFPGPDGLPEIQIVNENEKHLSNDTTSLTNELERSINEGVKMRGLVASEKREKFADRSTLSSVLPPLLAVMTLKNTLVSFVSAVSSSRADNPNSQSTLSPLTCQAGFCAPQLKANCWNISDFQSNPVSFGARSYCGHCHRHRGLNRNVFHSFRKQNHFGPNKKHLKSFQPASVSSHAKSVKNFETLGSPENHCCCRMTNVLDSVSVQHDLFPDITLGFQTRTFAPLFANT